MRNEKKYEQSYKMYTVSQLEKILAQGNYEKVKLILQQNQPVQKNHNDYHYISGLLFLQEGQPDQAVEHLQNVSGAYLIQTKYWNNFGKAYADIEKYHEAIDCYNQSISLDHGNEVAHYNMLCCYVQLEDISNAIKYLEHLLSIKKNDARYLSAAGDIARMQSHYKRAIQYYYKALSIDANHIGANSNISVLLMAFGKEREAFKYAQHARQLSPADVVVHLNLGRCLASMERYNEAMECFADAFEINPHSVHLITEIAEVWKISGNFQEASFWFQKALQIKEDHKKALAGVARILLETNQLNAALVFLEEKLQFYPDDPLLKQVYADALWDDGDANKAISMVKDSVGNDADNPFFLAKAGQMLASTGAVDKSVEYYNRALELNDKCIPALNGLAVKQRGNLALKWVNRILDVLESPYLKEHSRAQLHNSLAHYYDGQQKWELAATHLAQSNELQWKHHNNRNWNYDPCEHRNYIKQVKKTFSKEYFAQLDSSINSDETPVFIVGMPRSGTTLTEQILARHALVLGVGERHFASQSLLQATSNGQDVDHGKANIIENINALDSLQLKQIGQQYLQQLERLKIREKHTNAIRVVDKMPDNYSLLGWILTIFPKAKIIHCRRHPRDVAVSCWMTHFGSIQWASRLPDLIDRINQYQSMMEHWKKHIPDRFVEIDYEKLVENQEYESKRLIEWIGLNWDNNCLRFYESDRIVRTASITQVREPIYKRSVGRWKNYRPFIDELNKIKM